MSLDFSLAFLFALSMFLLIIGLRGVLIKRPAVYPGRIHFWFLMVAWAPMVVSLTQTMFDPVFRPFDLSDLIIRLLFGLMYLGLFIFSWWEFRGYIASGVTRESFQKALHASLEKLNLPYSQYLTLVELDSIGAQLHTSFQTWRGTARLKVKPRKHKQTLRDIAQNMNQYYKETPVRANLRDSIIDIVIGTAALAVAVYLTVRWMGRGV